MKRRKGRGKFTWIQGEDNVLDKDFVVPEYGVLLGQNHSAEMGLVRGNVLGNLGDKDPGVCELLRVGGHVRLLSF